MQATDEADGMRLRSLSSPPFVTPKLHTMLPPPPVKPRLSLVGLLAKPPLPSLPPSKPPISGTTAFPISNTFAGFAANDLQKTLSWKLSTDGTLIPTDPPVLPPAVPVRPFVGSDRSYAGGQSDSNDGKSSSEVGNFDPQLVWPTSTEPIDDIIRLTEARLPCEICRRPIQVGYALDHARFAVDDHLALLLLLRR
jgi:hypothetical protein